MQTDHSLEWAEAQKIHIGIDLVSAAERHLLFLAAVDRNRHLYHGPALLRAIYRYNAFWLPLLAKRSESSLAEENEPLVVPFDCEWIWHCHRLNPVQYKTDCEKLFGRILDNSNVVSSIQGASASKTEELWHRMYPEEPYEVDLATALAEDVSERMSKLENCSTYDFASAVNRQSPFSYQVSRPHMSHRVFLEEAAARYRGFLHLIRRNKERSIRKFCVPTYDVDLMWHTHQLHPASYCADLAKLLGKVLEHDDMDSDRTKGNKLDTGFSGTTAQWEETFGTRYWKAGAMYRGAAPSPVTATRFSSNVKSKEVLPSGADKLIQIQGVKSVEVFLEFTGVRNLPEDHKGKLYVTFSKSQPDMLFNVKRKLNVSAETGEKMVASFQCEPKGELHFELVSYFPSSLPIVKTKVLGSSSLALQNYLDPVTRLSDQAWLELAPHSGHGNSKPIGLHVAVSFTVPTPAPCVFHMVQSMPFSKSSCFFPFSERIKLAKSCTRIINDSDTEFFTLRMRSLKKHKGKENSIPFKEVIAVAKSGEEHKLAELLGSRWSLLDSQLSLQTAKGSSEEDYLCELSGAIMVKFLSGTKLDYQQRHSHGHETKNFVTVVEFSAQQPYGEAVALIDMKSGLVKVKKQELVLAMVTSAFILSHGLRIEGADALAVEPESLKANARAWAEEANDSYTQSKPSHFTSSVAGVAGLSMGINAAENTKLSPNTECLPAAGCGGCGSGCGNIVKSSGCGGCGSGCGGGCANNIKSSGCGGGCGSGCGGGCGSGCGNMAKGDTGGGCGGCGAGGCGSALYKATVNENANISWNSCSGQTTKETVPLGGEVAIA